MSLRDTLDRLFEESVLPQGNANGPTFAVDIKEQPDLYDLRAALPGMRPEDVQIEATENTISASGEFKQEQEEGEGQFLRREIRCGRFHRVFSLPVDIDPSHVEASFRDGVLAVTLPKGQMTRPRKIRVEDRSGQRTMSGTTTGGRTPEPMSAQSANGRDINAREDQPAGVATGRGWNDERR